MEEKKELSEKQKSQYVEFMVGGESVKLSIRDVKNYLVSGNKEDVTDQEVVIFINLCRFNHLNPWLKEAYLIKYGNEPATMVVGKEAFMKRAEANKAYSGFDAGIIVIDSNNNVNYRKGTIKLPDETVLGGYAEVWRKDREHSVRIEVSFDEYAAKKKDGTLNAQWTKRPATMIRKVALVQALREAFPGELGGMYTAEEQGMTEQSGTIYESSTDVSQEKIAKDPFANNNQQKEDTGETQEDVSSVGGLDLEEI